MLHIKSRTRFHFILSSIITLLSVACASSVAAPVSFSVSFDQTVRAEPATGRLIVYLLRENAPGGPMHQPADGFVEEDPQPLYGIDVAHAAPGQQLLVDDSATSFPVKLSELPPGKYRAQAVLDLSQENSNWHREPGNLYSDTFVFDNSVSPAGPIEIKLGRATKELKIARAIPNVEIVTVRSKLLSDFRGKDVFLRAGVALPVNYDPARAYAAVYEIPGYGGDHEMAYYKAMRRASRPPGSSAEQVAHNLFWIFLDPESPNGHTLFADSDNNGPVGKALVSELIPAIESKFKLIANPTGRLVTGHSSGGWSSIWLATEYPDVFGACWSSSPDPLDFRKFELVDIYKDANLYTDAAGKEVSSARSDGKSTMTTRQENAMEQVLGTHNDSSQQWDSWQAVWGHRAENGNPKPLYDPITGVIDHDEAESYRRYDIVDRLRKDPKRFVPIFRDRIRLVCGAQDTYYLNESVKSLQSELDTLDPPQPSAKHKGYVKLAPGDHQTVSESKEMQNWASEMMDYLRESGNAPPATQPAPDGR